MMNAKIEYRGGMNMTVKQETTISAPQRIYRVTNQKIKK